MLRRLPPGRLLLGRLLVCVVASASVLVIGAASPAAAASTTTSTTTAAPTGGGLSSWRGCGGKLQCATLTVPVDYSQPDGEQVNLAVARLRATQPDQRLGSLVFNFGGPGDAGTETLADYAEQIPLPSAPGTTS